MAEHNRCCERDMVGESVCLIGIRYCPVLQCCQMCGSVLVFKPIRSIAFRVNRDDGLVEIPS